MITRKWPCTRPSEEHGELQAQGKIPPISRFTTLAQRDRALAAPGQGAMFYVTNSEILIVVHLLKYS
jgi:hypothetical protein